MLQLYLRHGFYNTTVKIKHHFYTASGHNSLVIQCITKLLLVIRKFNPYHANNRIFTTHIQLIIQHWRQNYLKLPLLFKTIMVLQMFTRSAKDASTKHVTVVCMYVCMYASTYVHTYVCMHPCMYVCVCGDTHGANESFRTCLTHGSYRSHIEYNCFTTCDFRLPQWGTGELRSSGLLPSK